MNKKFFTRLVATSAVAFVAISSVSAAFATSAVTIVSPLETITAEDITYTAVSADGSLVAVKDEYEGVTIYEVPSMTRHDIPAEDYSYDSGGLVFSPDNNWLYIADYENYGVAVIDLTDFSFDRLITSPDLGQLWIPTVSPDGDFLYGKAYGGTIYKIDLRTETVVGELSVGGNGDIKNLCISGDGTTLYSPTKGDTLAVIETATMTVDDVWNLGAGARTIDCSLDNEGNILVAYTNIMGANPSAVAKFSPDGSVITTVDRIASSITGVVASCDTIYIGEEGQSDQIPTLDYSTLAMLETLTPGTSADDLFYGEHTTRSADGSVIAIGGYYPTDGLAIVLSPDCVGTDSGGGSETSGEALAATGADPSTAGLSATVGLGLLACGVLGLMFKRRRKA
jgi:sugar lactone lactonase YvrE